MNNTPYYIYAFTRSVNDALDRKIKDIEDDGNPFYFMFKHKNDGPQFYFIAYPEKFVILADHNNIPQTYDFLREKDMYEACYEIFEAQICGSHIMQDIDVVATRFDFGSFDDTATVDYYGLPKFPTTLVEGLLSDRNVSGNYILFAYFQITVRAS